MNRLHHWYCNRKAWKRQVRHDLVPSALEGLELGEDVLEVGPGFGPATEALADRVARVTALEIDPRRAAPRGWRTYYADIAKNVPHPHGGGPPSSPSFAAPAGPTQPAR